MHNLLKRVNAKASSLDEDPEWTEFSYKAGTIPKREPFELNVMTDNPTPSQLGTLLDYARQSGFPAHEVVKGATTKEHAVKLFRQDPGLFTRPTVSFWGRMCWMARTHADCEDRSWIGIMDGLSWEISRRRS